MTALTGALTDDGWATGAHRVDGYSLYKGRFIIFFLSLSLLSLPLNDSYPEKTRVLE